MFDIFKIGLCNRFFPNSTPHVIVGFFVVFALGYLLGSLNFGVILSKLLFRGDVREHGSGNAGTTNMLRTYGKLPAALTLLGDAAKTAAAVLVGALILGAHNNTFFVQGETIYSNIDALLRAGIQPGDATPYMGYSGMYVGGLAAIVGHAFPVFYKFKGGKGVIATFVTVLFTSPLVALVCLMFFVAVVAATKFVSLASIMSVIVYPLVLYRLDGLGLFNLIAIFIMLFVVFLHRANILKLMNGKESKISFKKKEEKKEE